MKETYSDLGPFHGELLTEDRFDEVLALMDRCAGKGMYSRADLHRAVDDPRCCFHVMISQTGDVAGYIYYALKDLDAMAAFAKLPRAHLEAVSPKAEPLVAEIVAAGLSGQYRGHGLGDRMLGFCIDHIVRCTEADMIVVVGWKVNGHAMLEKSKDRYGFLYLEDAHMVWYDHPTLVCPVCRGRCVCDAAVFYKPLMRGVDTEI